MYPSTSATYFATMMGFDEDSIKANRLTREGPSSVESRFCFGFVVLVGRNLLYFNGNGIRYVLD